MKKCMNLTVASMLFIHIGSLWLLLCFFVCTRFIFVFVACCVVTCVFGVHVYAHVTCCLAHLLSPVYAYAYYV